MPSKFPWPKSNRSHASVGSSLDASSSRSSVHQEGLPAQQYSSSEDQQQYYGQGIAQQSASHRLSSHGALHRPPVYSRPSDSPSTTADVAAQDSTFSINANSTEGGNIGSEHHRRSGLRSKLGFRHSTRETESKAQPGTVYGHSNEQGLGRTLSIRKKEPGGQKGPNSPIESQRRGHTLLSSRQSSTQQLPASEEEEEEQPGLDPFLVQPDQGPLVPPKDYQPSPASSVEQHPGRIIARGNSSQEQYSPSEPQADYHQQTQYQPYHQQQLQPPSQGSYQAFQASPAQLHNSISSLSQQSSQSSDKRPHPHQVDPPISRRSVPNQQQGVSEHTQQQGQQQLQAQPARESIQINTGANASLGSLRNQHDRPNSSGMPSGSSRDSAGYGQGSQGSSGLMQPPTPGISSYSSSNPTLNQQYKGNTSQIQQQHQSSDGGRNTPSQVPTASDLSEDEVNQIIKDHNQLIKEYKELREKYQKVKKYYFEKEGQVQQLQDTLANQRMSLSKTSLDDSEYATRFNRLDGLIAQLAFGIRKSWKTIPVWMQPAVNKDAVATGKQEMTAVGRAYISSWLVEEVFEKYFHPDLETGLSLQLKVIQNNLRRFAPFSQSSEEEEALMSKIVHWRLSTLEGLQEMLRSPQSTTNRQQLIESLNEKLVASLQMHLQEPSPPELEGGVHMIIDLVINNIACHLPLESRDVHIQYFPPGHAILAEFMKLETGIPALTNPCGDDTDRASLRSTASDLKDGAESRDTDSSSNKGDQEPKRKGVFGNLMGTRKAASNNAQQGKQEGAGGSQSSLTLQPPGSSSGSKEEAPPQRVRLAAFAAVQIRGRSVLFKAPVFST